MKKYLVTLLVLASVCFPKVSNAYFGGEPFGMSPFGLSKFGIGAFGEGVDDVWAGFGVTFLKQYDTNQSSLDADTSSGSPTATFDADRGSTTPATTIETQDGNALLFDKVDDTVSVAAHSSIDQNGATAFTIEATINPQSVGENNGTIVNKRGDGYYLVISNTAGNTARLACVFDFGGGTDAQIVTAADSSGRVNYNEESHVVITFNEDSDNKLKAYINGSLASLSTDTAGVGTLNDDSANAMAIGNDLSEGRTFDGQIKDVRIYRNKALTAAEALSRSNGGTVTGATAHWDMSDGSGTTVTDIVGSNNGTIAADSTAPQWLTDGSTYVTKVTSDDTPRWTTGYYAQNGVYTAGPGLLLEGASTNLFTYSFEFDHANWSKSGDVGGRDPVVTANQAVAPDGSLTADKIVYPAVAGSTQFSIVHQRPTQATAVHTFSLFLKGDAGGEVIYIMTTPDGASYETTTATLTTAWKRFEVVSAGDSMDAYCQFGVDTRDAGQADQSAQTVYAWGAQLEQAAYPSSFIPTTTAALTRNAEALTYVANDGNFSGGTDGSIALVYRPIMLPDEQAASSKKLFRTFIDGPNYWYIRYSDNGNDLAVIDTRSNNVSETAVGPAEPFGSIRNSLHSVIATYSTTADGSGKKLNGYIDGSATGWAQNVDYAAPIGSLPSVFEIQSDANQSMILVAVVLFSTRLSAEQALDAHNTLTGN